PGFKPMSDVRVRYVATDVNIEAEDMTRIDDKQIGTLGAAAVWVKPWIPADYQLIFAAGGDTPPLVWRQHSVAALRGLRLAFDNEGYPLRAQGFEAYGGAGVWTRSNGVIHYSGGAVYQDPAFA
ncbi:MAG TPA: hypothetical protein VF576_13300, partial [Rubricoccaceae bacterium]